MSSFVSFRPDLPPMPQQVNDLLPWAKNITRAMDFYLTQLSLRLDNIVTMDVAANIPAAGAGGRKFFYATDTDTLYFDKDGSWVAV